MYTLSLSALNIHDGKTITGETKEELVAKTFEYLEMHHPKVIGEPTIQHLAELQALIEKNMLSS